MKITTEMIMAKKPYCKEYTEAKIRELLGDGKTLEEILDTKLIPAEDIIWTVTRFLDDKTNREFAIWCARQCTTDITEITDYIDVIERFYHGEATEEELQAAGSAAYSAAHMPAFKAANRAANWTAYWAAHSAADWGAHSAADWATHSAANSAAHWAADSAAHWAANSAADSEAHWAADSAAERRKQKTKLKELIAEAK